MPLLVCGGLAKRFLVPGWRMGWIFIHDPLGIFEHGVRKGLQNLSARIIGSNTLVQGALGKILLLTPQSFHDDLINTLHVSKSFYLFFIDDIKSKKAILNLIFLKNRRINGCLLLKRELDYHLTFLKIFTLILSPHKLYI